jgi:uridine kinase
LVEGILLFKKKWLPFYDYKIWIDCSFEAGLRRALKRNIEKLDDERLLADYATFYYPAQRYHFKKDDPKGNADLIFDNNEYTC